MALTPPPQTAQLLKTLQGQTPLVNLQAAYSQCCALLAWLTTLGQPNVSIDGESYQTADLLAMLAEKREILKRAVQDEEGPWVVSTRLSP